MIIILFEILNLLEEEILKGNNEPTKRNLDKPNTKF
jgi:hypothetical protein